nr:glutathione S-transferase family protein [uncultured Dongia sp.]
MLQPTAPITLFAFGPAFDLPEASPYVMKTETQLKMAGLPYEKDFTGFDKAPKGKLPYIRDGETVVADSTFIRQHIEWSYGVDFDAGLNLQQRAAAWAVERMIEDHLGWAALRARWLDPVNFAKGPAHFFDRIPEEIRETMKEKTLAEIAQRLHGHGIGRHSDEDILFLGTRSLYSLSQMLGDKPYLMGDEPCGTDATAFGMLTHVMAPFFTTDLRKAAEAHANLRPYVDRMMARYYPEFSARQMAA